MKSYHFFIIYTGISSVSFNKVITIASDIIILIAVEYKFFKSQVSLQGYPYLINDEVWRSSKLEKHVIGKISSTIFL